jgi:mycothiol synthase
VDSKEFTLRVARDEDYVAEARLRAKLDPGYAPSADEIRHWRVSESSAPGHFLHRLVVDRRGSDEPVAFGDVAHTSFNFHPRKYWIMTIVDPAFEGRGIGTALYASLEQVALARNPLCLWTSVREGQVRAVRFFERNGFSVLRRTWRSQLEVNEAAVHAIPDRSRELAAEGVRFTSLVEEGWARDDVRHRVYDLGMAASADVPRAGEFEPVPYEQWVQIDVENPRSIPEGFLLAAVGDAYVGLTILQEISNRTDALHVGFTGTDPKFRGRGIASELKRRSVAFARNRGVRYLITNNDSLNHPMWAINQKLGFQRQDTRLVGEKTFPSTGDPL